MTAPRRFVELAAGTAAVSLCLQGGRAAGPVLSRPGNKRALAPAILGALGLRPGLGADSYLWCEREDGPRAFLDALPDPLLLDEVCGVLRAWLPSEPRALWDRLRGEFPTSAGGDARAVARHLVLHRWSFQEKGPAAGWGGPGSRVNAPTANWTTEQRDRAIGLERLAFLVEQSAAIRWPPVRVEADARSAVLLHGDVVHLDPSYAGTTPYAHNLTRADVLDLAARADRTGAVMAISEREPIEGLGTGWEAFEITAAHRGQARTWGGTPEWLTLNRRPVFRVAVQPPLFPGAP